ncbi:MAG: glycerol-3-phosphate 1-O-acyltransferase PlsY [Candidatus Binatia bacterium]
MWAVLLMVAAYFCGSLPIGVWAGRWAGIDVTRAGSGNIGATNVARTAGRWPAIVTLLGDTAKGALPALVGRCIGPDPWLAALVGLAAVFGHVFSVFLRLSGGKGVATAFGVFLVLTPAAALLSATVFAVTAAATRYASLASMLAATALPLAVAALRYPGPLEAAALAATALILVRHRVNLTRLRRGVEPKFHIRS